jgi:hypothetical protein
VIALCMDALTDDGALFYNHRLRVEHGEVRFPLGLDFGFPITKVITWDRGTGIDVTLRNFCSAYEWIVVLAKPDFRLVDHAASGMGDVWRLGMEREDLGHPAPFPVSPAEKAMLATGRADGPRPVHGLRDDAPGRAEPRAPRDRDRGRGAVLRDRRRPARARRPRRWERGPDPSKSRLPSSAEAERAQPSPNPEGSS